MHTFTISILATLDPVIRSSLAFQLATDSPDTIVIAHDVSEDGVRHVASDAHGVVAQAEAPLEHSCLSCAVREDVIPTLVRLRDAERWAHAVVALPVTADPAPLLRSLEHELGAAGALAGAHFGSTIAALDATTLADDAFSDEWLDDLDLALGGDDDRVLAEAVGPVLSIADTVLLVAEGQVSDEAHALAVHLRGEGATIQHADPINVDGSRLLSRRGRPRDALARIAPTHRPTRTLADESGIWTLTLDSPQGFHPERLRASIHRFAHHNVQARGHFWVGSRPQGLCVWEAAGHQVRVGEHGHWTSPAKRRTHLRITGKGANRTQIAQAFADSLLRPGEELDPHADTLDDWFSTDQ